jgi:hypothetical protein
MRSVTGAIWELFDAGAVARSASVLGESCLVLGLGCWDGGAGVVHATLVLGQ